MRAFHAEGVLFDFDGTLTKPSAIDFGAIRAMIGCPPDSFVLEHIASLPPGPERERALATLEQFEIEGAQRSQPNEAAEATVRRLRELGLRVGVLTRNSRAALEVAFAQFAALRPDDFDVIITRDDPVPPKPSPDGVLLAARRMGVLPQRLLVVGDFSLDILAGAAAQSVTVLLTNGAPALDHDASPGPDTREPIEADFTIHRLDELEAVVGLGLPLPAGKLPNELLVSFLSEAASDDAAVIVGAAIGEDVAALDVAGEEVIVVHGDPITLASTDVGRWTVLVNANDILTSGGEPRWLLTTVLLPVGTTGSHALTLLAETAAAAKAQGVSLIGGHTEITAIVSQPLVAAAMAGTVKRADLRDKRSVRTGDHVVLTKRLAVEGTALLAQELGARLLELGMSEAELAACRALTENLSIAAEARIARQFAAVTALHDVTEGGLATALEELSIACGHHISVRPDSIPVYAETQRVCLLLGADPLGLIASGSLLICCHPQEGAALLDALADAGIEATRIGTVEGPGRGVIGEASRRAAWPRFARDEAARLLASPAP